MQITARAGMEWPAKCTRSVGGRSPATEIRQHLGKALIRAKTCVLKARRTFCVKGMSAKILTRSQIYAISVGVVVSSVPPTENALH
jgi:hypothetical protein